MTSRFRPEPAWRLLDGLVALGPRYDERSRRSSFELVRADVAAWGASRVREDEFRTADGTRGWNLLAEYDGQVRWAGTLPNLKEWLAEYSLDQLWLMGELGGRPRVPSGAPSSRHS